MGISCVNKVLRFHVALASAFYIALAVLIYRGPLLSNGPDEFILTNDLQVPIYLENLLSKYYPLFNRIEGTSNFVATYNIAIAPFLVLAKLLNLHPMTTVEVVMVSATYLMGLTTYLTSRWFLIKVYKDGWHVFLASLLAGLFFFWNPHWANDPRHFSRKLTTSLIPLMFLLMFRGFDEKRPKLLILGALVWMVASSAPRNAVMGLILLLTIVVYSVAKDASGKSAKQALALVARNVGLAAVTVGSMVAFMSYRVISLVERVYSTGFPQPYARTLDSAIAPVKRASPLNQLTFDTYIRTHPYENIPDILQQPLVKDAILFLSLGVFAFSILALALHPNNKHVAFLTSSLVFWSLFSTGLNEHGIPGVKELYMWLIFEAPFSRTFFWAFRKPIAFWVVTPLFASLLVGFSTAYLLSTKRKVKRYFSLASVSLIVASIVIPSWPLATGDFNGVLDTVKVPEEYFDVNEWLANQEGKFKVIWLPKYRGARTLWNMEPENKYFNDISSSRETFAILTGPDKGRLVENYITNILSLNYRYKFDTIQTNSTDRLGSLLSPLAIRYVILDASVIPGKRLREVEEFERRGLEPWKVYSVSVREEIPKLPSRVKDTLIFLLSQEDLRLVYRKGYIFVFENAGYKEPVYTPEFITLVIGRWDVLVSLSSLNSLSPSRYPVVMASQVSPKVSKSFFDVSNLVVIQSWKDVLPIVVDRGYVIAPFDRTLEGKYKDGWARLLVSDLRYAQWGKVITKEKIPISDFDYGMGIVATKKRRAELKIPVEIAEEGIYRVLIRYLRHENKAYFKLALDDYSWMLNAKAPRTRFQLKDLGTVKLSKGFNYLTLKNVQGFNAVNFIMLIPIKKYEKYVEEASKIISGKRLLYLWNAARDFLLRDGAEASYGKLGYANGAYVRLSNGSYIFRFVNILREGSYVLGLRMTGKNGSVALSVGDYSFIIDLGATEPDEEGFYYVRGLYLSDNKKYRITVKSLEGDVKIDLVAMFSAEGATRLSDLVNARFNAEVSYFERVSPTSYRVTVKSSKPFVLALAEAFDGNWVAKVGGDVYEPFPLQGSVTGFYIERTGKLSVRLDYRPQEPFERGGMVTTGIVATVISAIALESKKSDAVGSFIGYLRRAPILKLKNAIGKRQRR